MSHRKRSIDQLQTGVASGINYIVPNVICKLLASAAILINLSWSRNHEVQLMGMGVASLFSQALGYLVVISLNLGLSYEIGRKRDIPEQVGIFYQRALFMNFVICAFLVTPLLYISKKVVTIFAHVDNSMAEVIGEFLFQLVPSIYCFALYDTTQTFLLAQHIYLAPLVINIFAVFCHFFLINHLGAAWSKNFTDLGCCIAIYVFLTFRKEKLPSWIEWNIQCIKNWSVHLNFIKNIGMSTYIQAFFFLLYSLLGYKLGRSELICHICFLNISQIFMTITIGLKEGMLIKVAYAIKKKLLANYKEEGRISMQIFLGVTVGILLLMLMYVSDIAKFFIVSESAQREFLHKCWILFFSLLIDSACLSLGTFLKALDKNYTALKIQALFYSLGIIIGYLLCYNGGMGFVGLWLGWIMGNTCSGVSMFFMFLKAQKKFTQMVNGQSKKTEEQQNLGKSNQQLQQYETQIEMKDLGRKS